MEAVNPVAGSNVYGKYDILFSNLERRPIGSRIFWTWYIWANSISVSFSMIESWVYRQRNSRSKNSGNWCIGVYRRIRMNWPANMSKSQFNSTSNHNPSPPPARHRLWVSGLESKYYVSVPQRQLPRNAIHELMPIRVWTINNSRITWCDATFACWILENSVKLWSLDVSDEHQSSLPSS